MLSPARYQSAGESTQPTPGIRPIGAYMLQNAELVLPTVEGRGRYRVQRKRGLCTQQVVYPKTLVKGKYEVG